MTGRQSWAMHWTLPDALQSQSLLRGLRPMPQDNVDQGAYVTWLAKGLGGLATFLDTLAASGVTLTQGELDALGINVDAVRNSFDVLKKQSSE